MKKNSDSIQSNRLQKSYDLLYADEKLGIPHLNLHRWPRNRWDGIIRCCPPQVFHALEIGCGNGVVLHYIAGKCDKLTGIEISAKRCDIAYKNLQNIKKPIEIIQGNIEEGINKPDGSFDLIIWADVIEHVVDIFAAMREIARLLSPGGLIITATPNIAYIRYRLALLFGKFPSTSAKQEGFAVRQNEMYDGGHLHYLTISTLKRFYLINKIKPLKVFGYGKLGWIHNLWPTLLSGTAQLIGRKE